MAKETMQTQLHAFRVVDHEDYSLGVVELYWARAKKEEAQARNEKKMKRILMEYFDATELEFVTPLNIGGYRENYFKVLVERPNEDPTEYELELKVTFLYGDENAQI